MTFSHYLIVDDDPVSTMLNKFAVEATTVASNKILFDDPVECMDYIVSGLLPTDANACILLDLNMPKLNGWQFLKEFARLPQSIRSNYTVVIVTSSFDPNDLKCAESHPFVSGYINKPLTAPTLKNQLEQLDQRSADADAA